ncbi:DMT family transporter [Planosporangium flavigriseum]|uniref:DMT family transporter n=1 Tax=Planosporangium flavigriseum TaxID=373681 RepID=UPI00143BFDF1|nr:DMT family transporter [Planosporangium flavigriseum]NJC66885.1 DMT family transporter [Planosporangium flavigriseum]
MNAAPSPDRTHLRSWLPGYLLLALIWGASFLFIKVGIRELHPLYVTLGRVVAGAVTVLALILVTRVRLPRDPRVWGHLAVVGMVGVAIPFTLFGYGEQRVSSVLAGIWNATTPLVALPVATLVFRTERMTARRLTGILVGFAGVLVVLGVWRGVGGVQLTGQLMCMAAAACYGIAIPYQRRFLGGLGGSGLVVPAGQLITATVALLVFAPLVAGAPPAPTALSGDVIASVLALGALGTGLAFVLNFRVIRFAGATTSASVTYLIPIVATVIGVVNLHEHLSWYQPVGALVILVGVSVSQGILRLPAAARKSAVQQGAVAAHTAAVEPVVQAAATPHEAQPSPIVGEVAAAAQGTVRE